MKSDLHLYIGINEVELTSVPSILYTYTVDDLTNPTTVKNSFSKTITIQGTPTNNKIFGHYWNVERVVEDTGQNAGVYFNASKKAPFTIIVNNEVYESGYVKLEKVNLVDETFTYEIGLFGSLGDFFYRLSYNDNTGEKLKLSELDYYTGGADEFDFTATASTIQSAWTSLKNGTNNVWQHINFMPAYNGYPDDFNADKVIINLSGTSLPQNDESGLYSGRDGYVIADLPQEMNEWEIRDLRSYLQRPCLRMKSFIAACCDPNQNGGYEVELDPDFFSSGNPYYEKTWISRPLIKDIQYENEEQILSGSSLIGMMTTGETTGYMYQDLKFEVGDYSQSTPSSIRMSSNVFVNNTLTGISITIDPFINVNLKDWAWPYTSYTRWWANWNDYYHSGWWCLGSLFVQLIALNGEVVVGASDAYNLTSPLRHNGKLYYGYNGYYSSERQFKPYLGKNIYNVLGEFHTDGFHREGESSPATLSFYINNLNSPVSQLKMVYWYGATNDKVKHFGRETFFQDTSGEGRNPGNIDISDPFNLSVGVKSTNMQAVLGDNLGRSGTKVTKATLLNTENSPADYLLSYCKMFGLFFRKEPYENKIYIETRKTFYRRNEVVNLNDYIDREKPILINPIVFDTKWYSMQQESDESEFYKDYLSAHGVEYGCKILNTGYEFSTEKKELYDESVIRSGIEGLERSKYFSTFNNDRVQRSWMGMGLHYNLYFGNETTSVDVPIRNNNDLRGINEGEGMKYYDVTPKLQFHGEEGTPTDGTDCLVFFSGFKSVSTGRTTQLYYYLTDDNRYQTIFNDGTPCWLFTAYDTDFAHRVTSLPVFERYYTDNNSGKVKKSLDFGTPQELYIPNYNLTENENIYSNFWRTYIDDLFDPDTKIMTCYVVINGKVGSEWLRRFYWYDNAIWRVNKVSDWDICSYGSTKVEFVKVQNVGDYNSITQSKGTTIILTANKYRIDAEGGQALLYVDIDTGGSWRLISTNGVVLSRTTGTGNATISATFPASNVDYVRSWFFKVSSDDGATCGISIQQGYDGEVDFTPVPADLIIPASGGSVFVDFIWKNQGDDYVDRIDLNEGDEYLQFTADTVTYRSENKALLTFSANTGNTTLSNYCQFRNREEDIRHSIGIDQLPARYNFDASGGTHEAIIRYSPRATFADVPDWVTITEEQEGEYTITAKENLYASENKAVITVTNEDGIKAKFEVLQATDGGVLELTSTGISPTNLYYSAVDATSKLVTINLTEGWWIDTSGNHFWTVTQENGDKGVNVIGVTVSDNTGATRTGYIPVHTESSEGVFENIIITQNGTGVTEAMEVTPTSVALTPAASSVTITVIYEGRSGFVLVPNVTAPATATPITWTGETGTTTVSIPENTSTSARTITANFLGRNVSGSTVFTQQGVPESGRVTYPDHVFDFSGGTANNGVSANTPWTATTNVDWITVSPTSGESGYTAISITGASNPNLTNRMGYVYIRSLSDNTVLATIIVTQGEFIETLTVNPSTLFFDSTGGILTFEITSNTNWTIE